MAKANKQNRTSIASIFEFFGLRDAWKHNTNTGNQDDIRYMPLLWQLDKDGQSVLHGELASIEYTNRPYVITNLFIDAFVHRSGVGSKRIAEYYATAIRDIFMLPMFDNANGRLEDLRGRDRGASVDGVVVTEYTMPSADARTTGLQLAATWAMQALSDNKLLYDPPHIYLSKLPEDTAYFLQAVIAASMLEGLEYDHKKACALFLIDANHIINIEESIPTLLREATQLMFDDRGVLIEACDKLLLDVLGSVSGDERQIRIGTQTCHITSAANRVELLMHALIRHYGRNQGADLYKLASALPGIFRK